MKPIGKGNEVARGLGGIPIPIFARQTASPFAGYGGANLRFATAWSRCALPRPLGPLKHPRRRGVKIFDFAVAVGEADLEAQRASNLTPSNGRALPGARWAAAQTRTARYNEGNYFPLLSDRFLPGPAQRRPGRIYDLRPVPATYQSSRAKKRKPPPGPSIKLAPRQGEFRFPLQKGFIFPLAPPEGCLKPAMKSQVGGI